MRGANEDRDGQIQRITCRSLRRLGKNGSCWLGCTSHGQRIAGPCHIPYPWNINTRIAPNQHQPSTSTSTPSCPAHQRQFVAPDPGLAHGLQVHLEFGAEESTELVGMGSHVVCGGGADFFVQFLVPCIRARVIRVRYLIGSRLPAASGGLMRASFYPAPANIQTPPHHPRVATP